MTPPPLERVFYCNIEESSLILSREYFAATSLKKDIFLSPEGTLLQHWSQPAGKMPPSLERAFCCNVEGSQAEGRSSFANWQSMNERELVRRRGELHFTTKESWFAIERGCLGWQERVGLTSHITTKEGWFDDQGFAYMTTKEGLMTRGCIWQRESKSLMKW